MYSEVLVEKVNQGDTVLLDSVYSKGIQVRKSDPLQHISLFAGHVLCFDSDKRAENI